MNTILRPPVNLVAVVALFVFSVDDFDHFEEAPPVFFLTLPAAALERADAPAVLEPPFERADRPPRELVADVEAELGPMSGIGMTLGKSSMLKSFVHKASRTGLIAGT